jgi:chromosomal replication initiator protein
MEKIFKRSINNSSELDKITKAISEYMEVPIEKLMHKTRKGEVNEARHLAMYFITKKTTATLLFIGNYFNRRDHSVVINGRDRIQDRIDTDQRFRLMTIEVDMMLDRIINEEKNNHSPEVNENLDVLEELKNQI